MRVWTLVAAAVVLAGWGSSGQAEQPVQGFAVPVAQPVKVELVSEHASIQPGGSMRIGVHFTLEDGWHIYAQNPGDAGLPTSVEWGAPGGISIGPLIWPPHQEFVEAGDIRTFGYIGDVVLSSELKAAPSLMPGVEQPISARVKWLACKEICLPGEAKLQIKLPVSSG